MSKKYNIQTECPYCSNPIIISYQKYRPFPKTPVTDVRLNIEVGCSHIAPGPVKPYIDFGVELKTMYENRRIDMQDLEDKERQQRLKEILGEYDPDSEYDPSRF